MVVTGMFVGSAALPGCGSSDKTKSPAKTARKTEIGEGKTAQQPEGPAETSTRKTPEAIAKIPKQPVIDSSKVAQPIAPPSMDVKVSAFAPAADLVVQVDEFIDKLADTVADEETFKDSELKIAKDSNTLIVMALALGLHDEQNKYQASASALMAAAGNLAAAKDLAAAKEAVAALKTAAAGNGPANTDLKWQEVAATAPLFEKSQTVHTTIKRYIRNKSRFKSKAKTLAGDAAVLAVIAHACIANTDGIKKDVENWEQEWVRYCVQMRDAAGALNTALSRVSYETAVEANKQLLKSCDDCHKVFHETALQE